MDQIAHLGVHLLETLFFFGIVGSAAVVLISALGDLRDLSGDDEND